MKRHFTHFLALLLPLSLCGTATLHAQQSKRLVAYYLSGDVNNTPPYTPDKIPYRKLTHIIHFCIWPDRDGNGGINTAGFIFSPDLIARAHAAGVKVLVSVGSGGLKTEAMRLIAESATARAAFAKNLHDFVVANGYDGIDIDWEVPNKGDMGAMTLMMQAIRDALPSPYLISMATSATPQWYGWYDFQGLAPIVDFFNVMTYDFHGPWTNHAGHNSPLVMNHADPGLEGSMLVSWEFYKGFHVPPEKINMATAFYGYEFDNAAGLWAYCTNDDCSAATSPNYGTYIKQRINGLGWVSNYDSVAMAPYLLREDGSLGFITYDDPASTSRKVDYAFGTMGVGGVFMWELSQDYDGQSQDLLDAMYKVFLKFSPPAAVAGGK